jgi:hypothetical protein
MARAVVDRCGVAAEEVNVAEEVDVAAEVATTETDKHGAVSCPKTVSIGLRPNGPSGGASVRGGGTGAHPQSPRETPSLLSPWLVGCGTGATRRGQPVST